MARTYTIRRDRSGLGPGFGIEEMSCFAGELSDAELLGKRGGLSADDRAAALAELGCIVEDGAVVTDPALDGAATEAA